MITQEEFKAFREQVYEKFKDYDSILRSLLQDKTSLIAGTFDDKTALQVKELYPTFSDIAGTYQKKGTRCRYEAGGQMNLYKLTAENATAEGTLILENWNPVDAPSIWTAIDIDHEGTLEDPIPAARGMEYIKGKYYIENSTVYLMSREGMADGEAVTLQYLPSELVGHYFTVV